jgi:hypothetical protein
MTTTRKTIAAVLATVAMASVTGGCVLQQSESDSSEYREAIPQQGDAQLAFAGSQASGATTGQSTTTKLQIQGLGGGGGTDYASFYEFTRTVSDGVDTGTLLILAEVALVTSFPPTSSNGSQAVWGPGGDALDPVQWRLTVTKTADHEFDYEVDGRPHGSTDNSAWQSILTGHGYGHAHALYRSGSFTLDGDTLKALDPTRSNGGKVAVKYDARAWPKTVTADVTTSEGTGQWYDITVGHDQDSGGTVVVTAMADISSPPDGTNESVDENSRWNSTGAGRADVKMSGGDLSSTVLASQCWSSVFAQTYYTDSVNYQPTSGDPSTCAFSQAQFNQ